MTWGFRIIHHDTALDPKHHHYALHEVVHRDGAIGGWSSDPVTFLSGVEEGPEAVIEELERAVRSARTGGILRLSDLQRHAAGSEEP